MLRPGLGHPHGFVEAYVVLVFDQDGFAGVKERWVLDEMTTLAVYEVINENGDHKLDDKEVEAVRQESFVGHDEYGFFTAIRIAGEPFDVKWATDFNASLENGKLVYDFFVPCHVKAASAPKEIKVAVFDPTFFVYVAYASESTQHFDPSKDPLFTDSSAPADPGDFQRFMAATGLGAFQVRSSWMGPTRSSMCGPRWPTPLTWPIFTTRSSPRRLPFSLTSNVPYL